jgi:hypothetical protein
MMIIVERKRKNVCEMCHGYGNIDKGDLCSFCFLFLQQILIAIHKRERKRLLQKKKARNEARLKKKQLVSLLERDERSDH